MKIDELDYANESILKMESAQTLDDYERCWKDFLTYIARFWNKCQDLCKTGDIPQKTISKVNQNRKADSLLQYIEHARNSNEHSVRQIVAKNGGFTTITGGDGGGTILRGTVQGNGEANLQTEGSLSIQFHPAYVEIVDVIDRGVSFPIPSSHLGQPVTTRKPHEIARLALAYYANETA